jgi:hypothetical protein
LAAASRAAKLFSSHALGALDLPRRDRESRVEREESYWRRKDARAGREMSEAEGGGAVRTAPAESCAGDVMS